MKPQSEIELINLVINWVRDHQKVNGSKHVEIAADTNLLEAGLLDSFGFIELILFVESRSDCKFDLTDVDPGEFCVVKGLCRIALRNHQHREGV